MYTGQVRIDTTNYERKHGRKPAGKAKSWEFLADGRSMFLAFGQWESARQGAIDWARQNGFRTISLER